MATPTPLDNRQYRKGERERDGEIGIAKLGMASPLPDVVAHIWQKQTFNDRCLIQFLRPVVDNGSVYDIHTAACSMHCVCELHIHQANSCAGIFSR